MIARLAMVAAAAGTLISGVSAQSTRDDPDTARRRDQSAPVRAYSSGDLDCADFNSWREAQDVLDADPGDRHSLDGDHDGVACEGLRRPFEF